MLPSVKWNQVRISIKTPIDVNVVCTELLDTEKQSVQRKAVVVLLVKPQRVEAELEGDE